MDKLTKPGCRPWEDYALQCESDAKMLRDMLIDATFLGSNRCMHCGQKTTCDPRCEVMLALKETAYLENV